MSAIQLTTNDEAIATLLASMPEGTNPFDEGLRPLIEGKDDRRDLPRASHIIGLAMNECEQGSLKWLALNLYQLEVGRRPPNADMGVIIIGLTATLTAISKLALDISKFGILLGDSWYNLGIAHRMTKEYMKAAEDQMKAAACYIMAGRMDKAWSSLFLVAVESFSAACVRADNPTEIRQAFHGLLGVRDLVESLFPGDKTPGWLKKNRQPHCLLAAIWANRMYDAEDADIQFCATELMAHLGAMAEVLNKPDDEMVIAAVTMADKFWDFPSSSTGNAVLTALLIGARKAKADGQIERARELYKRTLTWTGSDGAAPMAIARRELAAL